MEKKYLIFGMAVILGASLSFLGCEDKAEETVEPTAAELAAAELAASADFDGKVDVSGATVTLTKDVTLTADADVADGVTLAVPAGKGLTVPANKKLTNSGTIEVVGTYTLAQGATVTNNGTVTIKSGGVSKSNDNDNSAGATGYTVVETGGKAYFKDKLYFGNTSEANFQLGANTKFSFNTTGYVLNGTATLNGITGHLTDSGHTGPGWGLYAKGDNGQQLTLKANSTLTISGANTILDLNGTAEKQAIVGEAGSKVVIKTGVNNVTAGLWIYTGINFYDSAGAGLTNKTYYPQSDTTFNWDAAAGGSGKPGWKAVAPSS